MRPATLILTLLAMAQPGPAAEPPAEARALEFLAREVPRWHRENHCYSCHNNGDAARALFLAVGLKRPVPRVALADTTAWLVRPEGWDKNGGDGPFSDKRLARIEFAAALAAGVEAGAVRDRDALSRAATRLAVDQADDGHWPMDDGGMLGAPATYGQPLVTAMAREVLQTADSARYQAQLERSGRWLRAWPVKNVLEAAAVLRACASDRDAEAAALRRRCLELIRQAQARDGGWGPYATVAPEPFDTAVVLLALVRCPSDGSTAEMIRRGRAYLTATQLEDGSWPETTRPAGNESYAERISTAGWATQALLATAPP